MRPGPICIRARVCVCALVRVCGPVCSWLWVRACDGVRVGRDEEKGLGRGPGGSNVRAQRHHYCDAGGWGWDWVWPAGRVGPVRSVTIGWVKSGPAVRGVGAWPGRRARVGSVLAGSSAIWRLEALLGRPSVPQALLHGHVAMCRTWAAYAILSRAPPRGPAASNSKSIPPSFPGGLPHSGRFEAINLISRGTSRTTLPRGDTSILWKWNKGTYKNDYRMKLSRFYSVQLHFT